MLSDISLATIQASPLFEGGKILFIGLVFSTLLYLAIQWIVRIRAVERLLEKLLGSSKIGHDSLPRAIGKYFAVFVFLLFLRSAVEKAGYREIEEFLSNVVDYLPHLFLALLITFFGIQMSRTSYTLVYNAVHFENPSTAKILAYTARIIVIFFTITIAISQINAVTLEIIPDYLIKSILIGFVASASLAFGLAFGLGGREAASQIVKEYLNSRKKE